jgi:hypothetical protein
MISPGDGHCKNQAPSPTLEMFGRPLGITARALGCARDRCHRAGRNSGAHARRVAAEVVWLPFYGGLADDDVQRVCEMLHWLMR